MSKPTHFSISYGDCPVNSAKECITSFLNLFKNQIGDSLIHVNILLYLPELKQKHIECDTMMFQSFDEALAKCLDYHVIKIASVRCITVVIQNKWWCV
jgi:hypothetical protein